MAKPEKVGAVTEITNRFQESNAAVLTEYRGLTMTQLTTLRRTLGEGNTYAVVKNTLTKRAAAQAGVQGLDDLLSGPTAIAFINGDPVLAAKSLRDFSRANPLLVIKGGVLEGATVTAAEVARLADLESREVLLAKLAGAMKGNLSKAAGLFAAPLAQMARLAAALVDKRAETEPAAGDASSADVGTEDAADVGTEDAAATPTDDTPAVAAEAPAS